MCDSCVPTCSKPLRVSTNGCDLGQITLLIDSDDTATVIDVTVGIEELITAMQNARHRQVRELEERRTEKLIRQIIVGRQVKSFAPTHRVHRWMEIPLPTRVIVAMREMPVEVIDELAGMDQYGDPYWTGMLPNGYTMRFHPGWLKPFIEDEAP
jgi:hypothetical protein